MYTNKNLCQKNKIKKYISNKSQHPRKDTHEIEVNIHEKSAKYLNKWVKCVKYKLYLYISHQSLKCFPYIIFTVE